MMKIESGHSLILIILICTILSPAQQDVEEMMRKLQQQTQQYIDDHNRKIQAYIDKNDSLFAAFLEKDWQLRQSLQGVPLLEKPKPKTPPTVEARPRPKFEGKTIQPPPTPKPKPPPPPKPVVKPQPAGIRLSTDFFGMSIKIDYDPAIADAQLAKTDNESISHFWERLARADYPPLLESLQQYRTALQLNDWGYLQLLHKVSSEIYPHKNNEALLLTWFMLLKSDYQSKIGYTDNEIVLLLPTRQMLYSTPYLTQENQKYFIISFQDGENSFGSIYTFTGNYPGARQLTGMEIRRLPVFIRTEEQKVLRFQYGQQDYLVPVKFSRDAVTFFAHYPQTDYDVYFGTGLSPTANYSLLKALKSIVQGKSEAEATNMVLRFVQTAFQYQTDDEQFGREKPLFPEETLYYRYCDCEDRSVLFAYLIRQLLNLEVIGLHYPGHIATAVKFSDNIQGDAVVLDGANYLICDPTYINADIGQCMPRYKNSTPKIIRIKG